MSFKNFIIAVGLLVGATVGAGVFALPYVAQEAGWLQTALYGVALGGLVAFVHYTYVRVLEVNESGTNFLGLAQSRFSRQFYAVSVLVTLGNLVFALLIFLVLAGDFIQLMVNVPWGGAVALFWIATSLPLLFKNKTFLEVESWGTVFVAALLLLVGGNIFKGGLEDIRVLNGAEWFLPFGPLLFALTGWTALEPVVARARSARHKGSLVAFGMAAALLLYGIFVLGVLSFNSPVGPNTLSALPPGPAVALLAAIGVLAMWRCSLSLGEEMKNALRTFRFGKHIGLYITIFLPIILLLAGFRNLMSLLEIAGGIFLSFQYLLILILSRKVLKPKGIMSAAMYVCETLFFVAAAYTAYTFFR